MTCFCPLLNIAMMMVTDSNEFDTSLLILVDIELKYCVGNRASCRLIPNPLPLQTIFLSSV